MDLLALAAKNGHEELCSALIGKGSDPNKTVICWEQTALNLAIEGGHTKTVRLLLNKHSNPNFVDQGSSSLCWAARMHNSGIIAFLLQAQANPNIECQDCDFGCALEAATFYNRVSTARLLLHGGARVNLPLDVGNMEVHWRRLPITRDR